MRVILILVVALVASTSSLVAHGAGGCSCNKPPVASAPHGGEMEETAFNQYVELVADDERIAVYVMDQHLRPIPASNVAVSGTASVPRERTPQTLEFAPQGNRFISYVNIRPDTHRYSVRLQIETDEGREQLEFQVEL